MRSSLEEEAAKKAAEETRGMTLKEFEEFCSKEYENKNPLIIKTDDGSLKSIDGLKDKTLLSIRLDEDFFAKELKGLKLDGVLSTIKDNPLLFKLYQEKRLYISSKFRSTEKSIRKEIDSLLTSYDSRVKELELIPEDKRTNDQKEEILEKKKSQLKLEEAKEKIDMFYNPEQELKGILDRVEKELQEYKTNEFASDYLLKTLETLDKNSVAGKELQVHIELFPLLIGAGRGDYISGSKFGESSICFCPLNFEGTYIIAKLTPKALFGHELTHAVDRKIKSGSGSLLKKYCDSKEPEILEIGLECLDHLCSGKRIKAGSVYKFKELSKDGKINLECMAGHEFIAFHVENIVAKLNDSKDIEDFKKKYDTYIKESLDTFKTEHKVENITKYKLFALRARDSFMEEYIKTMKDSKVLEVANQVHEEHIDKTLDKIIEEDIAKDITDLTEKFTKYLDGGSIEESKNKFELKLNEFIEEDYDDVVINPNDEFVKKTIDKYKNEAKLEYLKKIGKALLPDYNGILNEFHLKIIYKLSDPKFNDLANIITGIQREFDLEIKQTLRETIKEHNKSISTDETSGEHKAGADLAKAAKREMQEKLEELRQGLEKFNYYREEFDEEKYKKELAEQVREIVKAAKEKGVGTEEVKEEWQEKWQESFGEELKFEPVDPIEREPERVDVVGGIETGHVGGI